MASSFQQPNNHLRERLWAAWEEHGSKIAEDDLAAVRQGLLQREDIKTDLMAWDISPEREGKIKTAIMEFLLQRTTRLRPLPSTVELLYQTIASFGPLDPLLKDNQVTNILVNGWDRVYFDRLGEGQNIRLEQTFRDANHYLSVFHRIVSVAGGVINAEEPCADLLLPDGTRVNASMPPYTRSHVLSLRLFRRRRFSLAELQARDALDDNVSSYIRNVLSARANVIVGGAVGTGKTTFINAVLSLLPPVERLVTAEDAPELKFEDRHWVAHYTRPAIPGETARKYDLRFVVRDMLRKRADRIVIGEVRGPEALDMLLAMNAGTCGWSSCHGHSSEDVLSRLCTFALLASENLSNGAIQQMVASVVDVVVMMGRCADGRLRAVAVDEVTGMAEGRFEVLPIFRLKEGTTSLLDRACCRTYVWEQLNSSRVPPGTQDAFYAEANGQDEPANMGAESTAASPLARAIELASNRAGKAAMEGREAEGERLAEVMRTLAALRTTVVGNHLLKTESPAVPVEAAS